MCVYIFRRMENYPVGRAKRCLVTVGLMVPVDEAEEAEEESSSG